MKYTIYLDFDGTVLEHAYPRLGRCNLGAFEVIRKLQDAGHQIILNTYRANINDNTLAEALDVLNEKSWMFFKRTGNSDSELLPITEYAQEKVHPHSWNWDTMLTTGVMYIDDIATGIPLKKAFKENSMMVDWATLNEEFLKHNVYSTHVTSPLKKKILYIDMDGVVADFDKGIKQLCPELETGDEFPDYESRSKKVDSICEANEDIFHNLEPIEGAVEAVNQLFDLFEVYFLSTPMWNVPASFSGKRIWIESHFGEKSKKRLILTHRKDLNMGDYLVDDRIKNGVSEFTGEHIHFATERFPNWELTLKYLQKVA